MPRLGVCVYCGHYGRMTKDHFIPKSKGGPDVPANIVPACRSCNVRKGNKYWSMRIPRHWLDPDPAVGRCQRCHHWRPIMQFSLKTIYCRTCTPEYHDTYRIRSPRPLRVAVKIPDSWEEWAAPSPRQRRKNHP